VRLEAPRVEAFLRDPGAARAVLFYGEDAGLIAERAARLTRRVAGALDDPFRVADLDRDAHRRLLEEVRSLPLSGGRRVVRVRDAGDGLVAQVEAALGDPTGGLMVFEAPGLPSRSRLRAVIERAADAVAIACYPVEGNGLGGEIRAALQAFAVEVDTDAVIWLQGRLGADSLATRGELAKLALFAGAGGRVDVAAAQACAGDLAAITLEDALFAATAGDAAGADRALERALAEGLAPVGVLRAALMHMQRLHRVLGGMAAGRAAADAIKALRPPLFFRREPAFRRALDLWSERRLAAAAVALWRAESACKRTGAPAEAICRRVMLDVAREAGRGGDGQRPRAGRQSRDRSVRTPSN
jgi:DNA polymerase-3 subunit delta